ncbi:hypothetical protein [Streptomyces sp. NPDC001744]|uniref:hypothetical protein n=1 Tax=Streptomyces sp. NPDC001744 TaxID=3364606 RepID=UPI00367E89C7
MRRWKRMRKHDEIAAALADALRPADVDDASTRAAVAAFRAARDAGLHTSRHTGRREDWRPVPERRTGRSLRATLSALAASLTLGGVAIAASVPLGPVDDTETREPEPRPSTAVPLPSEEPTGPLPGPPPPYEPPSPRATAAPLVPRASVQPPWKGEPPCRPRQEKTPGRDGAVEAPGREGSAGAARDRHSWTPCDPRPAAPAPPSAPDFGNRHSGAPPKAPSAPAPDRKRAAPSHTPGAPAGDTKAGGRGAGDRT